MRLLAGPSAGAYNNPPTGPNPLAGFLLELDIGAKLKGEDEKEGKGKSGRILTRVVRIKNENGWKFTRKK